MRITDSVISMTGESSVYKNYSKEESLRVWAGNTRPDFEGNSARQAGQQADVVVELSDQAKAMLAAGKRQQAVVAQADKAGDLEISDRDMQKIQVVQKMLELLTGKKVKFFVFNKVKLSAEKAELNNAGANNAAVRQGWGLEYDYHESYYEQEKMSFTAQGMVKTADGREIGFAVNLRMSREFASRLDINIRAGDAAVDPLVINFNGAAPALTDAKYSFDIDCDGLKDQISFVGPGSGFLALDINGDGQVNNGGELFGPGSGDGFADLAQYDEDGNGWIDEGDSVFSRLRIWTKDTGGNDVLFTLGQKGVGAIFLGSTSTPFEIKDRENNLDGQVRNSGVFLFENGLAGTVQQIDLVI